MAAVAASQETTSPMPSRVPVRAPDAASKPASNTAATDTCSAPGAGFALVLDMVHWSYDGTPTGGSLTVAWGSESMVLSITAGGPGFLPFPNWQFPANTAVTLTLAAGGSGVSGKVYGSFRKVQL